MSTTILNILYYIEEYLFPHGCALCGRTLLDIEETWYGLCRNCRTEIRITEGERCRVCGRPLISEIDVCLPCRNGGVRSYDQVVCIFPYKGKYQKLLIAYKYGRSRALGNFFRDMLKEALQFLPLDKINNPVWVPVPPRPGKIKSSGWDQIEFLAKLLDREYRKKAGTPSSAENTPMPPVFPVRRRLKRLPTKTQKELNREMRRVNLAGKIRSKNAPKEVLLFDDVITTGSTLDACAEALKKAGAEKVYGICLFYD
ncbi:MAG: double zinc ribbon domain-containing protein [Treponema sp.]|nr:double zinc ribbon domain-containing protein [Treponema sp.]